MLSHYADPKPSKVSPEESAALVDVVRNAMESLFAKKALGKAKEPSSSVSKQSDATPTVSVPSASLPPVSQPEKVKGASPQSNTARKSAGKSRLSQVWGPADFETEANSRNLVAPAMHPATSSPTAGEDQISQKVKESSCILCGASTMHPYSDCPSMLIGAEAIEKRMQELKSAGTEDAVLEEVQAHLNQVKQKQQLATEVDKSQDKPRETHEASDDASSPRLSQLASRDLSPEIPFPSSPAIPVGSEIVEVLVQEQHEGSSSESESDEEEDASPSTSEPPASVPTVPPSSRAEPDEDSLEALLRPPVPTQTILAQFDAEGSSDEDSEPLQLASEDEDRADRAYRRLSKKFERDAPSSDEEDVGEPEADGAMSPATETVEREVFLSSYFLAASRLIERADFYGITPAVRRYRDERDCPRISRRAGEF